MSRSEGRAIPKYLLDTNVVIDVIKRWPLKLMGVFNQKPDARRSRRSP